MLWRCTTRVAAKVCRSNLTDSSASDKAAGLSEQAAGCRGAVRTDGDRARPAKHNDVQQAVCAQAIGTVHARAAHSTHTVLLRAVYPRFCRLAYGSLLHCDHKAHRMHIIKMGHRHMTRVRFSEGICPTCITRQHAGTSYSLLGVEKPYLAASPAAYRPGTMASWLDSVGRTTWPRRLVGMPPML